MTTELFTPSETAAAVVETAESRTVWAVISTSTEGYTDVTCVCATVEEAIYQRNEQFLAFPEEIHGIRCTFIRSPGIRRM